MTILSSIAACTRAAVKKAVAAHEAALWAGVNAAYNQVDQAADVEYDAIELSRKANERKRAATAAVEAAQRHADAVEQAVEAELASLPKYR